MADNARNTRATIIPTMRYRDAPAAIDWLSRAFCFERHLVVPGEDGTQARAGAEEGGGAAAGGMSGDAGLCARGAAETRSPMTISATSRDQLVDARAKPWHDGREVEASLGQSGSAAVRRRDLVSSSCQALGLVSTSLRAGPPGCARQRASLRVSAPPRDQREARETW